MAKFEPLSALSGDILHHLPHKAWLPIHQSPCDFESYVFEKVALNLIKNPNINSSLLFRADILYDSHHKESITVQEHGNDAREAHEAALQRYSIRDGEFPGFEVKRTLVRLMVPRNPQLDKPIAQTCQFLQSITEQGLEENLVVYIPHTSFVDDLPWYHPRVQSVAYLHTWHPQSTSTIELLNNSRASLSQTTQGNISLHYRLYSTDSLPLSDRLLRTAHHLLSTLHKHGQGYLAGYAKRVQHDQLIPQQRIQDTYTELKRKHAKRLCDNWVEQTEPSKHVFEDLGIAAFLIELWKDMYEGSRKEKTEVSGQNKPSFPGFVDIGCGNGVLVDVLIREGYRGWGFDARNRKTWATFEPFVQRNLKEMILIPQPLFEIGSSRNQADGGIVSQNQMVPKSEPYQGTKDIAWHNGIFASGTFIISNHADELTPWTPLLASVSSSPFLAIPCCSHNLSGLRFRAPSAFNSYSADVCAPCYFASNITKSKAVAINTACMEIEEEQSAEGDLKDLSIEARLKQPSAYSSLCDWVSHLTSEAGYVVEKEILRLPSTRNMGILGRAWIEGFEHESSEHRMERVNRIARKEKANGIIWVKGAKGLLGGKSIAH